MNRVFPLAGLVLVAARDMSLSAQEAEDPAVTPDLPAFAAAAFADPAPNPWFPLDPGTITTTSVRNVDSELEIGTTLVKSPGPVLLRVQTIDVLDEVRADDLLVESTHSYFATDMDGNVWYFGEDVTNYAYDDDDTLTGTDGEGTCRAGVNSALPGVTFPAAPRPRPAMFQEYAPNDGAMDWARVEAVGESLQGPAGSFADVVRTFESSPTPAPSSITPRGAA